MVTCEPDSAQVHLEFERLLENETFPIASPEVVIFQSSSRDFTDDIGWVVTPTNGSNATVNPDARVFCCSSNWVDRIQGCSQATLGTLLLNPAIPNVWRSRYIATSNNSLLPTKKTFNVTATGRHTLVVANCDAQGDLLVTGQVLWKNPFGYLPGQLYGYLPVRASRAGDA